MGEWKETNLGAICSNISYGYTASANLNAVGPKFLRITDIVPDRIDWQNVPYCEADVATIEKYKLQTGDILIARTGATTGYNKIIKNTPFDTIYASYLIRYQIDKTQAFPFYIGHLLQSSSWYDYVDAIAGGSAQPGANAKQLATFEIILPPLPEQKAIASVLSSLDDKIDLLHRQNKTLEAMAETLFRQWFVEKDSAAIYKFETLVNSISVKHSFPNETIIFLNTSDIYDGYVLKHEYSEVEGLPGQAKKSIQKGDILFTEIRPANRRFAFVDFDAEDYVVSTKLMVLRPTNILSRSILFFYLKQQETLDWLQMLAEGRSGTFPQITFDDLKTLEISVPTERKLVELTSLFDSILNKTFKNQSHIRTLEKLRDTLLPKLMSGEVRVEYEH